MLELSRRFRTALRSKVLQSSLLVVLVVSFLGANQSRFDRLGHQMICICGCTQILLECNHVGCPDSERMIGELREQLSSGGPDTAVLNWFAAKYGPTVFAAPIRGGFDNVAWITPLAVFVLATVGTAFTVWAWRRRTLRLTPAQPYTDRFNSHTPKEQAMRDRIRQETEYR
jgi:cytochrome c-type biogenesis protein CcmH/NrfF